MPSRWNNAAKIRRTQIESGIDITFCYVFVPLYKKYVSEIKPNSILEIGAGTGHLALELSKHCSSYTAIEPSIGMYNVANEVLHNHDIEVLNCKIEDFKAKNSFNLVFSHLCAHAIEDIDSLFRKMYELVTTDGEWMFSIPHPCFYNEYKKMIPQNYLYMKEIKVDFDLKITKDNKVIEKIPYYHRPLNVYINKMAKNGLILSSMNEIFPNEEVQLLYGDKWIQPRYIVFSGRRDNNCTFT